MKYFKKIAGIILSVALIISLCLSVSAAGSFDMINGGTARPLFDGNDYGDDWGGGDWGGGDYDNDWNGGSSSGGGGSISAGTVIIFIIIVSVVVATSKKGKKGSGQGTGKVVYNNQGRNVTLPDRTEQVQNIIKQHDPDFSASDFVSFAKNVYIDIQTAWCNRDLTPVRPVMHENLYNTTAKQVESKIKQGVVYHYESIAINTAYITSYIKDSQFEFVTIYLNARMIDYQVDEKTGNIIKGDKTTRWDMRYKMKFVRSMGSLTKHETDSLEGHSCPHCGAPLNMSSSAVCEYCGATVTTGQYSWVLTDFTTVRNDTVDEGIKGVN